MTRSQRIALAMAGYPVKPEPGRHLLRLPVSPGAIESLKRSWRAFDATHNRASILVSSPKGIPCA